MCSEYFDTTDQALRRAGITFWRSTGTDEGWHLTLPHGEHGEHGGRIDADRSDDVPDELSRLLLGVTRGGSLTVVATVETDRRATRMLNGANDSVADIELDHTQSTARSDEGTIASSPTRLAIRLSGPPDKQLALLARRVRDSDARPWRSTSELARALGEPSQEKKRSKKRKPRKQQAGEVLLRYLAEQQHALLVGDVALRHGDDSLIHRTRVATRRLRSTLRVFSPFLDSNRGRILDGELRWFAEVLGAVRDGQVLKLRLDDGGAGHAA